VDSELFPDHRMEDMRSRARGIKRVTEQSPRPKGGGHVQRLSEGRTGTPTPGGTKLVHMKNSYVIQ
jgi:hypothetical protein